MIQTLEKVWNAQELESLQSKDKNFELWEGKLLKMTPAGPRHGNVAARICRFLDEYLEFNPLGIVLGAETGFQLSEHTVLAPDAAVVKWEQIGPMGLPKQGFFPGAPCLAVEILSPHDQGRAGEVLQKVSMYLKAGTALVWVIDPRLAKAVIHRPNDLADVVHLDGSLSGEDILPGLVISMKQVLRHVS